MKNSMLGSKEVNVKVGDRVVTYGERGVVTEVLKYTFKGEDYTAVRINFSGMISEYPQYQDKVFNHFTVI